MSDRKDEDLVRSCLHGDQRAFAEVVSRYQKPLFNLALRMTADPDDAKDVVQAAFVKAYEKLATYQHQYHFFSWLYRIAINESINFLRQRKRFTPLREEILPDELQGEKTFQDPDVAEYLQIALMRIKLEYRTVIILRHFQELSYEEIAYILNLSVERVKSRLFTARGLLKQVLLKLGVKYEK
jgi:RNA polymerase sigma-70 factor, ECF subfamily